MLFRSYQSIGRNAVFSYQGIALQLAEKHHLVQTALSRFSMENRDTHRSKLQMLKEVLRRIFRPKPKSPGDPYADILVPVRSGPKGRSGAAVAEPEEDSFRTFPRRTQ
jgi:hypothetical protein